MLPFDPHPILLELWKFIKEVLNSAFVSAFLSALAGAAFGVWGAQRIANKSAERSQLLDAMRQANAGVVLAYSIANNALTIKKQFVKPLATRFFADKERFTPLNEKILQGTPTGQIDFVAEMIKVAPVTIPIGALNGIAGTSHLLPGRAYALIAMIDQSFNELNSSLVARSDLIDQFQRAQLPPQIFFQDYFGLKRVDGNTNSLYADSMLAIKQYTDDLAFFAAELSEELSSHAQRIRTKLKKSMKDAPKANTVDFTPAVESDLLPPKSSYESWLRGFQ